MRPEKMRLIALTLLVAISKLGTTQSLTAAQLAAASRSVVRVSGTNCNSSDRAGTGFVWPIRENIVTALHVVNGCSNISVYSESTQKTRVAHIYRVLKLKDLALLAVDNPSDLPALSLASGSPTLGDAIVSLGYPLDIQKLTSTSFKIRFGGKQLREIVPAEVATELRNLAALDTEMEITNVEGHLLPGLSGAPLINSAARVVAVGDGGLENGTVGISWALPTKYLEQLANSTEVIAAGTERSRHLFAADMDSSRGPTITCGSIKMAKVRTRSFAEIEHSSDDPKSLQQLVTTSGMDPNLVSFDVYQHLESGATIAVPAGAVLKPESTGCSATFADGNVEMFMAVSPTISSDDVQVQSTDFEYARLIPPKATWSVDPNWSYPVPITRFDGLTVRRKSLVQYRNVEVAGIGLVPTTDKYIFETLAARDNIFIGVSTIKRNYWTEVNAAQLGCRVQALATPPCQKVNKEFLEWFESILAVQLTTFPIG